MRALRRCQNTLVSRNGLSVRSVSKASTSGTRDVWKEWTSSKNEVVESAQHLLSGAGGVIDGQWIAESKDQSRFVVTDPATGSGIASLPNMGAADTRDAIESAQRAFLDWRSTAASVRCEFAYQIFVRLKTYSEPLARIMSIECGKPLAEARGEVNYAASFFRWFAEEGRRDYGEIIPSNMDGRRLMTIRQPVGVCGLITPWNFPLAMIARKLAPALVTGCTSVMKPAPQTPLTMVAMCRILEECGLPPGVVNMVVADIPTSKSIGQEMCDNFDVRKISFTGSTAAGVHLAEQATKTMKRYSGELGGHAPFIVFESANVDDAVKGAVASKFRNAGQTCVCSNRYFIADRIYDEFSEKFTKEVQSLKLGHGFDDGTQIGPLIDERGTLKSEAHVNDAVAKGAKVLCGGKRYSAEGLKSDAFFEPTVLDGVSTEAIITTEETFGPVAPLYRFSDEDEVVAAANRTKAGLMGYFYSNQLDQVFRVAERMDYGMVGVNSGLISTEIAPFGGVKMSGVGREGGSQGIGEYTQTKYICIDNLKGL